MVPEACLNGWFRRCCNNVDGRAGCSQMHGAPLLPIQPQHQPFVTGTDRICPSQCCLEKTTIFYQTGRLDWFSTPPDKQEGQHNRGVDHTLKTSNPSVFYRQYFPYFLHIDSSPLTKSLSCHLHTCDLSCDLLTSCRPQLA